MRKQRKRNVYLEITHITTNINFVIIELTVCARQLEKFLLRELYKYNTFRKMDVSVHTGVKIQGASGHEAQIEEVFYLSFIYHFQINRKSRLSRKML